MAKLFFMECESGLLLLLVSTSKHILSASRLHISLVTGLTTPSIHPLVWLPHSYVIFIDLLPRSQAVERIHEFT